MERLPGLCRRQQQDLRTLIAGRVNALSADVMTAYDPVRSSAFSLIGFDRRQVEARRGSSGQPVEIGRPDRADKIDLHQVRQQAVANMWLRVSHLLLKEGAPVVGDRKTLADVEALFIRRIFAPRAPPITPAAAAAAPGLTTTEQLPRKTLRR